MLKRYIPLVICLLSAPLVAWTQLNLDSLWSVWNDPHQPDKDRLEAIRVYIYQGYMYSQPDSAFYFAQIWYDYAVSIDHHISIGNALTAQGISLDIQGDYDLAIEYITRGLKIFESIEHKEGIGNALLGIGSLYLAKGEYKKAVSYLTKSLVFLKEVDHKYSIASATNNLGIIYKHYGDFPKAIEYYTLGLSMYEALRDKSGTSKLLNNLAILYKSQGNYEKALEFHQRSLRLKEESNDQEGIATAFNNLGGVYIDMDDPEQAMDYFQKSLKIREALGMKVGIASSKLHIGSVYHAMGEYAQALEYFKQGLLIYKQIGDKRGSANAHLNMGEIYLKQQAYTNSLVHLKTSLQLSQEMGLPNGIRKAAHTLYEGYKKLGRTTQALEMYELHIRMRDSMENEQNRSAIIRQEIQYDFEKQALEDSLQFASEQAAKDAIILREQNRRNALAIGLGLFILLAAVIYYQYRQTRKARKRAEREHARSEELLLNILPAETAHELKEKGYTTAKKFEEVTVLFADIKSFTTIAENLTPELLVKEIDIYFSTFDDIIQEHGMEKIKTVGDAYIAVGGLPEQNHADAVLVLLAAKAMQAAVADLRKEREAQNRSFFEIRVGLHTGPVVAGVVGVKKFQYDIWGDTVNIAARMEQYSEPGQINLSRITYEFVKDHPDFQFVSRGSIPVKNKGEMQMYFVAEKSP